MNIKAAIKYLKEGKSDQQEQGEYHEERYNEALDVAIEASEKQIAKRPVKRDIPNDKLAWLCPTCYTVYWKYEYINNYCDRCGQKFDLDQGELEGNK